MDTETTEETQTVVEEAPVTTNSNAELDAAQAALAVMPDETEAGSDDANAGIKAESTKELGKITAFRAVKRALGNEVAALETKRDALLAAPAKEVPKSPMETFVESNPDAIAPGEVHLAQSKYDKAMAATEKQINDKDAANVALTERGKATIQRGAAKYSDFQEVYEDAADLLTKGDLVDIRDEEQPEDLLYKRSIDRIREENGERWKTLATRLRAKQVVTESVKKKAPKEPDGSEVPESNKAHQSAHIARLHDVL